MQFRLPSEELQLGEQTVSCASISTITQDSRVEPLSKTAKKLGMITIALAGKDGGNAEGIVDYPLVVSSNSVPRIQEVHITIGHVICQMVDYKLFQKPEE